MGENGGNGHGRDPMTGRLLPNHRLSVGNKGNPIAQRLNELRKILLDAATEEDVRDLYRSLLISAKGGDTAAARVLLEYLCGKPTQAIEVSSPDGSKIDLGEIAAVVISVIGEDNWEMRERLGKAFIELGMKQRGPG
jgi:hypothetical protein